LRVFAWVYSEVHMTKASSAVPKGHHTVTPSLTLDNAAQAIEWYKKALGAEETTRAVGPDGKIMHAEIRIGDSLIMLMDTMMGAKGPKAFGGSPASLWLYVNDSDSLFSRAVGAGATVQMPMADQFWGDRGGAVADPAGYTWWISTRKEDLTEAEINQRAEDFFKQMAHAQP
jgi:PhnB protein